MVQSKSRLHSRILLDIFSSATNIDSFKESAETIQLDKTEKIWNNPRNNEKAKKNTQTSTQIIFAEKLYWISYKRKKEKTS